MIIKAKKIKDRFPLYSYSLERYHLSPTDFIPSGVFQKNNPFCIISKFKNCRTSLTISSYFQRITPCIPSGVLRKVQSSYTSQIQEPQGISCIFEVEGISILLRNPQQRQTFKETWIWCSCTNSLASLCTTPQRVSVQISSKSLCSC